MKAKANLNLKRLLTPFWLQDGPFKQKEMNGCPQIDKFATYSINSIAKGRTSPRIGILGVSTYPSEHEYMTTNLAQKTGGQSQFGASQALSSAHSAASPSAVFTGQGRIDDVSASVNKQIKDLEVSIVAWLAFLIFACTLLGSTGHWLRYAVALQGRGRPDKKGDRRHDECLGREDRGCPGRAPSGISARLQDSQRSNKGTERRKRNPLQESEAGTQGNGVVEGQDKCVPSED